LRRCGPVVGAGTDFFVVDPGAAAGASAAVGTAAAAGAAAAAGVVVDVVAAVAVVATTTVAATADADLLFNVLLNISIRSSDAAGSGVAGGGTVTGADEDPGAEVGAGTGTGVPIVVVALELGDGITIDTALARGTFSLSVLVFEVGATMGDSVRVIVTVVDDVIVVEPAAGVLAVDTDVAFKLVLLPGAMIDIDVDVVLVCAIASLIPRVRTGKLSDADAVEVHRIGFSAAISAATAGARMAASTMSVFEDGGTVEAGSMELSVDGMAAVAVEAPVPVVAVSVPV
jgi:hypothetical protein